MRDFIGLMNTVFRSQARDKENRLSWPVGMSRTGLIDNCISKLVCLDFARRIPETLSLEFVCFCNLLDMKSVQPEVRRLDGIDELLVMSDPLKFSILSVCLILDIVVNCTIVFLLRVSLFSRYVDECFELVTGLSVSVNSSNTTRQTMN